MFPNMQSGVTGAADADAVKPKTNKLASVILKNIFFILFTSFLIFKQLYNIYRNSQTIF
ncbi:hypothetical protein GCM10007971_32170 [Oceanobacillus indicireducens]|uniref:Uncharacterized protein n=1 Tax=Oceanobacillus indicireducens TaxID=1004261 RepID=A0A917Y224_9BACI|nr:hypothetical protein GCM10007971_32170 [Oceanobacillus indicireducens]